MGERIVWVKWNRGVFKASSNPGLRLRVGELLNELTASLFQRFLSKRHAETTWNSRGSSLGTSDG